MAKKRISRTVKAAALKETKQVKKSNVPYVLAFIATAFLLVNGLTIALISKDFATLMGLVAGVSVDASSLVTTGIIWIVLGILIWITMHEIEKKNSSSQKWFLFVIGLIAMISGRLESGVLASIAGVLYLTRK